MSPVLTLRRALGTLLLLFLAGTCVRAQDHSVARQWNEEMLEAIRNDFARPVVHARNLYHTSAAMYDSWSLVHKRGRPALLGTTQNGYTLPLEHWLIPDFADPDAAADEAVSYAAFRMLNHRYATSPNAVTTLPRFAALMNELGYDPDYTGQDPTSGNPADLGNYAAAQIIAYGRQDGANEAQDYANFEYPDPVNPPLRFNSVFSIFAVQNPNFWQTLQFPGTIVDQSGQVLGDSLLPFLGAEWGRVTPFALTEDERSDPDPADPWRGNSPVYHDPGPPPLWSPGGLTESFDQYRWGFELVLKWSSHLDPTDGVMWDISPGARGNFQGDYPTDFADYPEFYREEEGGTFGADGHPVNPATGQPYPPNLVPRGDYTRVLAEFWADGPESETPPGHWFTILNKVTDHPDFTRNFAGTEPMDALEYDVKAYLTLGGAMHDAAISAWSIKGKYDYARPITAIRWMAKNGQGSEPTDPNYNLFGLLYDDGLIEPAGDLSELENNTTLALTRAKAWIGPDAIEDPETDVAGVGWINPALWYPYQRPNFVTPNFAGYISGHSTYSSAAATILERVTGDPYFPGGVGEFVARRNEFLVFEEGPSVDVVLQWATYRDASDQTSLSRIWGGIHPPADDVPGRIIGMDVGEQSFEKAAEIFADDLSSVAVPTRREPLKAYPNPAPRGGLLSLELPVEPNGQLLTIYNSSGQRVGELRARTTTVYVPTANLPNGTYFVYSADGSLRTGFQIF